ncbi:hypothetical protein ACFWVM_01465 [Nocardia fluminea]|uniref:hypothetical protein n=1 Tax=Nocardia fluminea TaxID=134984 RepID=UPI00366A0838
MSLIVVALLGGLIASSGGFGAVVVYGLGVVVALFVLSLVLSAVARRQVSYSVSAPRSEVVGWVYAELKKVGWKEVNGRGELNYQSRGLGVGVQGRKHPVLSVDFEDLPGGGTEVNLWMSEWESVLGMVPAWDRVLSKRWMLGRRLSGISTVSKIAG